jgi:hypothetical protein
MCGRVRLSSDVSEIRIAFRIPPERPIPNFPPSWNAAPTDPLPVVRLDAKAGQRSLDLLRWGLIPYWAKEIPINRCRTSVVEPMMETLAELPLTGDQSVCLRRNQAARMCHGIRDTVARATTPPQERMAMTPLRQRASVPIMIPARCSSPVARTNPTVKASVSSARQLDAMSMAMRDRKYADDHERRGDRHLSRRRDECPEHDNGEGDQQQLGEIDFEWLAEFATRSLCEMYDEV